MTFLGDLPEALQWIIIILVAGGAIYLMAYIILPLVLVYAVGVAIYDSLNKGKKDEN